MKWKLFVALLLMAFGAGSPRLWDQAVAWWNTPPAPPREEAARLIASLEEAEGWTAREKVNGFGCAFQTLAKGEIAVHLHTWHADVDATKVDMSDSFTRAERRAINAAGETCLRKLTARALDQGTK